MNKDAKNILLTIKEYLRENPNLQFTQALFNLGINEFADETNQKEKEHLLRDIYNDSDNDVFQRIENKKHLHNTEVELFERAFVVQLRQNSGDLELSINLELQSELSKRKAFYDNNFRLTPKRITYLTELNNIFKEKEQAIYESCKDIEGHILAHNKKSKNPFMDYEMDIELTYYSDKIIRQYKKYELDYLYMDSSTFIYTKKENRSKDAPDNNWLNFIAPKDYINPTINLLNSKINLCRTFFCLMEYSYLSLQDILLIDNIWWDIKVSYQFNNTL